MTVVSKLVWYLLTSRLIEVAEGNKSRLGKVPVRPCAAPLSLSERNGSVEIGDDDNKKSSLLQVPSVTDGV